MKFFRLLLDNLNKMSSVIISLTILAGIFNSLILLIINKSMEKGLQIHRIPLFYLFTFLICLILFVYCKRYALLKGSSYIESIIKKMRLQIVEKVRKSELLSLEKIKANKIFTTVSAETVVISEATSAIINASSGLIMLIISFFYLWSLSPFAFYLCLLFLLFNLLLYFMGRNQDSSGSSESGPSGPTGSSTPSGSSGAGHVSPDGLFTSLHHILFGQKELKINRAKREDLFHNYFEVFSHQSKDLKVQSHLHIENTNLRTLSFLYFLLGAIVFIVPSYTTASSQLLIKLTSVILFMMGPLESLLQTWPALQKAEMALTRLEELDQQIDQELNVSLLKVESKAVLPVEFTQMAMKDLVFHYKVQRPGMKVSSQVLAEDSFSIGPVNLTLTKGEVLFIVGGNGQGKSTLLKVLTGLYFPQEGGIYWDNQLIHPGLYSAYRQKFSAIFADFFLFDRPYGEEPLDPQQMENLLVEMQLRDKTAFEGGKFTHLQLSTGQRKRLAFIVASLENKSIYVFDEWAADQDPQFRRYFYEVLLKDLKKRGKTVIVVTHDDHYFHLADRIVTMEHGRLR